jgi:general secretion pathway protein B
MSYILEALKKAQAERQLGNAPTIHAPPLIHPVPAGPAASRKPLLIGLGAGVLLLAVAAAVAWRQQGGEPARAPVVVAASTPTAAPAAPAVVPGPAPSPAPVVPEPAPLPAAAVSPKSAARPAPAAIPEPGARPAPAAIPDPGPRPTRPPGTAVAKTEPRPLPESSVGVTDAGSRPAQAERGASSAALAAATSPTAPQPEAEPAAYEGVRGLQTLPEVIQREVPKVVFGGYIYSQNPADRLMLIDKTLRREGEQVAPGLVLERLLPKAAVMNYRGYRYRVPY